VGKMSDKTTNTFWSVVYTILALLIVGTVLSLLNVFSLTSIVAGVLYTAAVIFLLLAIVHWIGIL
jgi:hypothetical protein